MRYSLDVRVVGPQAFLDRVVAALPSIGDLRVDPALYTPPMIAESMNGEVALSAMIRFREEADRATVEQAVLDLRGMFEEAEPGTRLALHTCYHDEKLSKPCEETVIYEVVASD